jgi:hypothetical protein
MSRLPSSATLRTPPSDLAFTESVKAAQTRHGTRAAYERMERRGGWATELDEGVTAFIEAQTSFFLATATAQGQPYIQHRGGPAGFLHVLDSQTLAFADLEGNGQYISVGNLAENPKVHLFLVDYARQQRVKVWGEARVVEDDAPLLARLTSPGTKPAARALVIRVATWDVNCPKHIPQLFEAKAVASALEAKDRRIAELEAALREARR